MKPAALSYTVARALLGAILGCAAYAVLAAESEGGLAYVSNQAGDISIIDLGTLQMSGHVNPYGKEPRGIGVTADGKLLVVANRAEGAISVIDRRSGTLLRHVAIGANPEFVRVRGHRAFVSYEPSSSGTPPLQPSAAVAGAAPAVQGPSAAPRKDDDESHTPAHVAVVDLDRGRVVRSILGGLETEGIEFSADGRRILIANEADNNISVRDIATGALVATIDTKRYGNRPRGIKLAPDGKSYVATLELSDTLLVIDARYRVVRSVKTAQSPYGVAFDSSGRRVFVAAARGKVLQVFDTASYAPVKEIPIGQRCWHFTFTPGHEHILVACGRSGDIVVIDAETLEPVKHIADPETPWGMVTFPKSEGSLDRPE
ncbi:MAG TPA: cytochrome D1 domain-containing protein [Caldimonas sp.]|nr:cytochrome D1 domain-containing protein [Caldimonas sp.]